jgi:hypothetical protein
MIMIFTKHGDRDKCNRKTRYIPITLLSTQQIEHHFMALKSLPQTHDCNLLKVGMSLLSGTRSC